MWTVLFFVLLAVLAICGILVILGGRDTLKRVTELEKKIKENKNGGD